MNQLYPNMESNEPCEFNMKQFTFNFYWLNVLKKVTNIYAYDENEAYKKADRLIKQNSNKYDDWEDVTDKTDEFLEPLKAVITETFINYRGRIIERVNENSFKVGTKEYPDLNQAKKAVDNSFTSFSNPW